MKKLLFLSLGLFILTSGCTTFTNSMMASGVQLQGNTNYEILGDTTGTGESTYFLFFKLPSDDSYLLGSLTNMNEPNPFNFAAVKRAQCASAAEYKAIKNFEGADQIICPRYATETNCYIIFTQVKSTVTAKAIKIKK